MINIKNFDPNLLSINKISYKNTDAVVYNIKYIMMESINNQNIDSENPLCFVFSEVDAYIIKESGNKYLIFSLTKNNKKVLAEYTKLWNETKNQIKTISSGESIKYKKDFMEIRSDSNDDDLPLSKILSIAILSIIVKSVFQNENKYYPQIHIHECEYECEYEL